MPPYTVTLTLPQNNVLCRVYDKACNVTQAFAKLAGINKRRNS
jgi:hypothetical protein